MGPKIPPPLPPGVPPIISQAPPPAPPRQAGVSAYVPMEPSPRDARPGMVTAIGAASVAIGLLSAAASLVVLFVSFALLMESTAPGAGAPAATPPVPAAAAPVALNGTVTIGGVPIDPATLTQGLDGPARVAIVRLLSRNRLMNAQREGQIDLLIAAAGKRIFPFAEVDASPERIKADITEVGTLPTPTGARGPDFFEVGRGRIEVYDTHAIFRPAGSSDVVSVVARPAAAPALPATAPAPTPVVTPPPAAQPPLPVAATVISLLESLLSAVLAIFLIVLGVLVLRDSRPALRLHWVYAGVKIPLAILAGVMGWWMWSGLVSSGSGMQRHWGGQVMQLVVMVLAGLSLIYPIALLIILRRRDVRSYITGRAGVD